MADHTRNLSSVSEELPNNIYHDTIAFERKMLQLITAGRVKELEILFATRSPGQPGRIASSHLRQAKNLFVITATLASRAAIAGGMSAEEALTLSDNYIQHCEKHEDPSRILNLQYHMVLDYTSRVQVLTSGRQYDKFMRDAISYVREHLNKEISVEMMAQDLYLSRSYLSTRFKRESGQTLQQYIQEQKIQKAKEYLRNTDRSILDISTILGFSSQGHFQNVFKRYTGVTPRKFREEA